MSEYWNYLIIMCVGIAAGFINTVAGGGSLLSLPVLIFMGLPPSVANGTNRLSIFAQNIFAVRGFQSKGVSEFPYAYWLAGTSLIGALLGAKLAIDISGELFNRILAIVMMAVIAITIFNPLGKTGGDHEIMTKGRKGLTIFLFFFVGIYGGFIQAGVGFIMISILTLTNKFSLVKTNSIKVFVALVYTFFAIIIFVIEDRINWPLGIALAVGNSTGGWFASRWSVEKGDKWIRVILVVAVSGMAVKLWFF